MEILKGYKEVDYLDQLSEVQKQAVTTIQGPSLIIAGAGSGKTRVLTYRIAHLLQQGVPPWSILSLTFTNKAAREMKDRIANVVGESVAKQLWMGTFHSMFMRILRQEGEKLGYPKTFTIYDTYDSKNLVSSIIKELKLDTQTYKVGEVYGKISSAKNTHRPMLPTPTWLHTIGKPANPRLPEYTVCTFSVATNRAPWISTIYC